MICALIKTIEQFDQEQKNIKNQIYYSDRKDDIDVKLGQFLCNYPEREKIKILFLRESEGVY